MLLLEDCDELIRGDAKSDTGQSLSRLLNLTDGLLGQGLEVIVGITTNEPLPKLHSAIVRPGGAGIGAPVGSAAGGGGASSSGRRAMGVCSSPRPQPTRVGRSLSV